jgi:hypothetical protein
MQEVKLKNKVIMIESQWLIRERKKVRSLMTAMAMMTNTTRVLVEIHTASLLVVEENKSIKTREERLNKR